MVIRTIALKYDDRVRKECLSILRSGESVHILVLEKANEPKEGVTGYGVPYTSVSIKLREKIAQGRGLVPKVMEMYLRFLPHLIRLRADTIWVHNMEMAGLVPVLRLLQQAGYFERLVWDQHELPSRSTLQSPLLMRGMAWLNHLCDTIIMANNERVNYLRNQTGCLSKQFVVLRNFADKAFAQSTSQKLPAEVEAWLDGAPFVLLQGGGGPGRYFEHAVGAVLHVEGIKAIVVGPYRQDKVDELEQAWPAFRKRILLAGFVDQMRLIDYIDQAACSLIMYEMEDPNNQMCEPNRLYQALARRCPVVVGCNPPMARLVHDTRAGVVLGTDGHDVDDVVRGLQRLLEDHQQFREAASASIDVLLWERQDETVADIVGGQK